MIKYGAGLIRFESYDEIFKFVGNKFNERATKIKGETTEVEGWIVEVACEIAYERREKDDGDMIIAEPVIDYAIEETIKHINL